MTINMYDSKVLCGHEAAEALDKYIRKLEKRKAKGLTEKNKSMPWSKQPKYCELKLPDPTTTKKQQTQP